MVALAFAVGGCGTSSENRADVPAETDGDEEELSETADSTALGNEPLTEAQKSRLGPALRRLLTGDSTGARPAGFRDLSPVGKRDGKSIYPVTIQGVGMGKLREVGISQASEVGGIVTARLTAGQIRRLASVEEVRRIRASEQATPQDGDPRQ